MTQEEALTILKTGANVFLTGEPGSGKTHTVSRYVAYLHSCCIEPALTASTGIAATHIGGQTIHSWCGIGARRQLTPYDLDAIAANRKAASRIADAKILVIDEVSMLSAQTLSMAEAVCREVRKSRDPFGGLQVVFVGDFFQLPPVARAEHGGEQRAKELFYSPRFSDSRDSSDFAFVSSAWRQASPLVCYIAEQHRQEDPAFLELLNSVRKGVVAERHKALLRTRYRKSAEKGITQLYPHNADVDRINNEELLRLSGKPNVFTMTGKGPDHLLSLLRRGCLSPETLSLKEGARVIFTKNDIAGRFVNGTTGVVAGFAKEGGTPIVEMDSGRRICAEPMEWHMQDGGKILARIIQVPLRLAWAITVHKSQGMSLAAAHMDLSSVFEYGQGYVALSRLRTLKGLSLAGLNARALEVHPDIRAKDEYFRQNSDAARQRFQKMEQSEISALHDNFIRAIGGSPDRILSGNGFAGKPGMSKPARAKKRGDGTLSLTKELILKKLSLPDIAKKRARTVGTILHHLEELTGKGELVPARDLMHLSPDPDRFAKIEKAFKKISTEAMRGEHDALRGPSGFIKLSPVRSLLDDSYSFDELRLARLFLKS
ncbi:MAG: hypothetical protein A3H73_01535 [Candidatus Taylorbacteria bacterium RIFCSPLOWO2_02_FULL_50_120]|nr:MAG: AAA ATPase [Parcubacteria group bacterium GW2011_GWF2_50_9]OHA21364.1 MAG: hypothetical protein A2759_00395 [Candidatus Taylorbacteria bacterium RIFCSPHIGHO2_01_FULL_49_60]OHA35686.1 MAG: hypothetical protein A2W65_01285 [Candidatus Taylorbacteria bacterium RIFCSPLOWO2_02_50_13]OHA36441.1 MAG: hypothetical protein A3B27_02605 [Candidatus Taylorbacteria bacterium RIFCSPLOWO2_01_FULL_50_130]OHA42847.1 MAG: hypothetical protein A3H73_01535 [Candidatus Taylorbacteria bacterium RIFCSPLOWO2_0